MPRPCGVVTREGNQAAGERVGGDATQRGRNQVQHPSWDPHAVGEERSGFGRLQRSPGCARGLQLLGGGVCLGHQLGARRRDLTAGILDLPLQQLAAVVPTAPLRTLVLGGAVGRCLCGGGGPTLGDVTGTAATTAAAVARRWAALAY